MSSDSAPPGAAVEDAQIAQPSTAGLAEEIRKQVETEQALVDAQRKLKELEDEVESIRKAKQVVEGERDGSSRFYALVVFCSRCLCLDSTTDQLRTQLTTLQSSHYQVSSQLSVSQTRLDVSRPYMLPDEDSRNRQLIERSESCWTR